MKRIVLNLFILILLVLKSLSASAQCTATNTAFHAGESLSYDLYFNWKFVWLKAGTANFSIGNTTHKGEEAYRCHLITRTSSKLDRFFVMRDTLVSVVSKELAPLYFRKGALEGDRYKVDEIWYSYPNGNTRIKQRYRNHRGKISIQDNTVDFCIYDMLSMLLRARSYKSKDYKKGERINFIMADGDQVERQTLVYRGKENFTMENTGTTYRCLVFSFVENKDGKEKDVVTFYVTDDDNHLPVRLDLYLRFGTAKAFLTNVKGARNPQTSVVK